MKTKLVSLMVIMALLVSSMGTAIYAAEQPARLTVGEEYKLTEYETYFEFVPENDGEAGLGHRVWGCHAGGVRKQKAAYGKGKKVDEGHAFLPGEILEGGKSVLQ